MSKRADSMRKLYQERRNRRVCVRCEEPCRLAYCDGCATIRKAEKQQPLRNTDKVLELYCGQFYTVRAIAAIMGVSVWCVRSRLYAAGVCRAQGVGMHDRYVLWVEAASKDSRSWEARGRDVGSDGTRAKRVVQRWLDASRPWVLKAVEEHKKGRPWHEVAAAVDKDEEDTRTFVSRRVAYERRLKELSK